MKTPCISGKKGNVGTLVRLAIAIVGTGLVAWGLLTGVVRFSDVPALPSITTCSVGSIGNSAVVVFKGKDSQDICDAWVEKYPTTWYDLGSMPPHLPMACQYNVDSYVVTVRDSGLQLIGSSLCRSLSTSASN